MGAGYQAKMTSDDQRPPENNAHLEGDDAVSELESAEQYVRAHELIESLRAERRPVRDTGSEDDARLSATAALLHAASPESESGAVDPIFAARLFARLQAEQARLAGESAPAETPAEAASPTEVAETASGQPPARRRVGVTRRGVLLGGLGAAAAAFAGAGVTAALEQSGKQSPATAPTSALVPEGTGIWVAIAALDAAPQGAVKRFEAGAVIGYLQHTASGFVALSGVCTHMACLLQWNSGEQTFDCPCHGGRFLTNGKAAPGALYPYPPLPVIQTKVEAGQVWVYVTGGAVNDQFPSSAATPTTRSYGATGPQDVK
jgi:Rieske Fe-S protein